jgi:hypothetical protein
LALLVGRPIAVVRAMLWLELKFDLNDYPGLDPTVRAGTGQAPQPAPTHLRRGHEGYVRVQPTPPPAVSSWVPRSAGCPSAVPWSSTHAARRRFVEG